MKDVADRMEAIARAQLAYLEEASKIRKLTDEEWEALAHLARVVRTLAVHGVKDEKEQAPAASVAELAQALKDLASGKLK